jgi:hypothetical protein
MIKPFLIICIGVMALSSCHENPVPPEPLPPLPAKQWQKYIGMYDVFDTTNHMQWIMEIKFISSSGHIDGQNDSLLLQNFANKFDIRYAFGASLDPDRLRLPFIFPLKDKHGYSWAFSGNGEDTTTTHLENYYQHDSIVMYFKQSNIAFYQADGVSYYECDCKHIAVKRH